MALSESARVTTAAEARFRIRDPNSQPRAVMVVALDEPAARLAATLSERSWRGMTFFVAPDAPLPDPDTAGGSFSSWLKTITGQAIDLTEEVARHDVVQMLTTAGHNAPAVPLIGEACVVRGVKTSGLIIDDRQADAATLTRSLQVLRPWVMTLSVIGSAGYVDEILHALGG